MTDPELDRLVEAWKMTVQVQQHFNDIELRIRALVITVLTAVVGAVAVAVQQNRADLGAAIAFVGIIATVVFWFVDEIWYHRLLLGSVQNGLVLEGILPTGFGLTKAIGDSSPWTAPAILGGKTLHSTDKLRVFYVGLGLMLAVVFLIAGGLALAGRTTSPASTSGAASHSTPSPSNKHQQNSNVGP